MEFADGLTRLTIRCPGPRGTLFRELRELSKDHIVEDIRAEEQSEDRHLIELATDDLEAVRSVLRRHAPNATVVVIHDNADATAKPQPR